MDEVDWIKENIKKSLILEIAELDALDKQLLSCKKRIESLKIAETCDHDWESDTVGMQINIDICTKCGHSCAY